MIEKNLGDSFHQAAEDEQAWARRSSTRMNSTRREISETAEFEQ
tara:strand:+ start:2445 stop:2576 length:132 start_codon:yes stop_codon:yes gene_type:complete